MSRSFRGGIHPPCRKEASAESAIERMSAPKRVVVPLQQHIGATCEPLVSVGERVYMGQKIGDSSARISAPVHSSVSGTVAAIEERHHPNGRKVLSVVIDNDFKDEIVSGLIGTPDLDRLSPEEVVSRIREAGIVGMGGGGFPTHAKLAAPEGITLDAVLLNGAECEPYLTCDHRVMLEWAEEVVFGLRCLMKGAKVSKGFIGVETNKRDAIDALQKEVEGSTDIKIIPLQVKFPQGAEVQLVDACLGRKIPSGKLPLHVGVIVNNVHTAQAVARSIRTGMPCVERVVTVTGACIEKAGNPLVRVGTTFADILELQGLKCEPVKLVSGGPMMGLAMYTSEVPVCKCTSGILALGPGETTYNEPTPCVRCGKCVDACPMLLHPLFLGHFGEKGMAERAEEYGALDCKECGACTYVCPAYRPLTQAIRMAKSDIYARQK